MLLWLLLTLVWIGVQFNEHAELEKGYSKADVAAVQAGLLGAAESAQRNLTSIGKWGERASLQSQLQPFVALVASQISLT